MPAALLLVAALGLVTWNTFAGRTFAARIAALAGGASRPRMLVGWALGIFVTYGVTALVALAVLRRSGDVLAIPSELRAAAWRLGLPGASDRAAIAVLFGALLLGMTLGGAILWWRGRRGRRSIGLGYRSPAAVRTRAEIPAAILLSCAAGISEELYFRLLVPLLAALVFGVALAGCAIGLAAFVAVHRYQGRVPMLGIALVGVALTWLYLATGALWFAMLVHALIDVSALVIRPLLDARLTSSHPAAR